MKIGNIEVNKKLFITFIVVMVLTVAVFIIKKIYVKDFEDYKIDKDKEFVYTYKTYSNSETDVPYINIDSSFAKTLNESLQKMASKYENSTTSNYSMNYGYNVSENIISLVIIFKSLNENNQLVFDFTTYVFDLNKDGRALTDDEILKIYNITPDKINEQINLQMVKKYDKEINENILPGECGYLDCFMKLRNVDKFTDNAHYFIEDSKLVVYTTYNVYSDYKEENFFTRNDFKFYINNSKK